MDKRYQIKFWQAGKVVTTIVHTHSNNSARCVFRDVYANAEIISVTKLV